MSKAKIFTYFDARRSADDVGASSKSTGNVRRNPSGNHGDRKVLVDIGDKCVNPARSKPKRRKTVMKIDEEMDTPVTESILWSDQMYNVSQLSKKFSGDKMPLIVKVDEGYYRDGVLDLARGQVILVNGFGKQRRVMATNNAQEPITIPFDYNMKLYLQSSEEHLDLRSAVEGKALPFKGQVELVGSLSDTTQGNLIGEDLTFLAIKETTFLCANIITQGWIDQSEILIIPEFLSVKFSLALGLRAASHVEWVDYCGMFSRSVRHLDYDSISGYQGIFFQGLDGNLSPSVLSSTQGDENLNSNRNSKSIARYENVTSKPRLPAYENMRPKNAPESAQTITGTQETLVEEISESFENVNYAVDVIGCKNGTLDYKTSQQRRNDAMKDTQEDDGSETVVLNGESASYKRTFSKVSSCEMNDESIDKMFDSLISLTTEPKEEEESEDDDVRGYERINPVEIEDVIVLLEISSSHVRKEDDVDRENRTKEKKEVVALLASEKDMSSEQKEDSQNNRNNNYKMTVENFNQDKILTKQISSVSEISVENSPLYVNIVSERPRSQGVTVRGLTDLFQANQQLNMSDSGKQTISNLVRSNQSVQVVNPVLEDSKPTPVIRKSILETPHPILKPTVLDKPNPDNLKPSNPNKLKPVGCKSNDTMKETESSSTPEKPSQDLQKEAKLRNSKLSDKPPPPPPTGCLPKTHFAKSNDYTIFKSTAPKAGPDKQALIKSNAEQENLAREEKCSINLVINSLIDVPVHLKSLSVNDVSRCLKLLSLDSHIDKFAKASIDGKALEDLDEKILQRQFLFTPFDASKLVRFTRGWRP